MGKESVTEKGGQKKRRSRWILLATVGLFLLGGSVTFRLVMPGALFLIRFLDDSQPADLSDTSFEVTEITIARDALTVPGRLYKPAAGYDRVLLVIHGVHHKGYDEPRLVSFAERLADLGFAVVTPDMADLRNYEIVPQAVDDIEKISLWTLIDSDLVEPEGEGKIGLLGISFSGGLCLSAASRPSLRGKTAFVFSFGGHADLDATMEYLATGRLPDRSCLPPHVYGQAVLVRKFADRLVPPEELPSLRETLCWYLTERFDETRERLGSLSPRSRELVSLCLDRDTEELGKILLPHILASSSDHSLSPIKGPPPDCPVFLLHGRGDNVIPASETVKLAAWASPATETTSLVSDLIQHVEMKGTGESFSLFEYWKIIRFWTELLRS